MDESRGESLPETRREFPPPLRRALLEFFRDRGPAPSDVWRRFAQSEGYGSAGDHVDAVVARDGEPAGVAYTAGMLAEVDRLMRAEGLSSATTSARQSAMLTAAAALVAMPDADFRVAVEHGIQSTIVAVDASYMGDAYSPGDGVRDHVNELFQRRGVPYRLDREDRLAFEGDEALHELVMAPALAVLADERLAGVRAEFEDAVAKLGSGGQKDLEDAIEESRKAVEGTMRVLIDLDSRVKLPRRQTIDDLIRTLVDGGVVESETRPLLECVSRIANSLASHSAASELRHTPGDLAVATVSAAATAIAFLAARLP